MKSAIVQLAVEKLFSYIILEDPIKVSWYEKVYRWDFLYNQKSSM